MDMWQMALGFGLATAITEDEKKKRERNSIEIPDNATNGDAIKALFPSAKACDFPSCWWNAPYRREGEEE